MASKTGTKGYSPRPGELRIGDCLRLPGDAPFVLFGIAEDLGIRTNIGGRHRQDGLCYGVSLVSKGLHTLGYRRRPQQLHAPALGRARCPRSARERP